MCNDDKLLNRCVYVEQRTDFFLNVINAHYQATNRITSRKVKLSVISAAAKQRGKRPFNSKVFQRPNDKVFFMNLSKWFVWAEIATVNVHTPRNYRVF